MSAKLSPRASFDSLSWMNHSMAEPPIIHQPPVVESPQPAQGDDCGKPKPAGIWERFLGSKLGILAAIFFAMMFLGIPLLWKSPRFNTAERIVWTIVTIAYSALVFWLFYLVMAWSYSRIFPS